VPARTIGELIALAKAKPGNLSYGSAGVGTTPHLSAELFRKVANVEITHVPYRGTSAAVPDLTTGDLHLMFGDVSTLRPFIESGAVAALAVTGSARSKLLPQVPTVVEAGYPALTVRNFSALLAPASTDPAALKALNDALVRAKKDAGFVSRLETQGMSAIDSSPDHARDYLRTEKSVWEPLVQAIGLKAQ
jgi:tripartite-type tricarboxylate transporter receptor subunit TctC